MTNVNNYFWFEILLIKTMICFPLSTNKYEIQKRFIKDATELIENNGIGIFSSPTGTGKTLSLLCTATKFIQTDTDELDFLLNKRNKNQIFYCSKTHAH